MPNAFGQIMSENQHRPGPSVKTMNTYYLRDLMARLCLVYYQPLGISI